MATSSKSDRTGLSETQQYIRLTDTINTVFQVAPDASDEVRALNASRSEQNRAVVNSAFKPATQSLHIANDESGEYELLVSCGSKASRWKVAHLCLFAVPAELPQQAPLLEGPSSGKATPQAGQNTASQWNHEAAPESPWYLTASWNSSPNLQAKRESVEQLQSRRLFKTATLAFSTGLAAASLGDWYGEPTRTVLS